MIFLVARVFIKDQDSGIFRVSSYRNLLYNSLIVIQATIHTAVKRKEKTVTMNYTIHAPKTAAECEAYHNIRMTQIHNRYCPDLIYDYDDPEEKQTNSFPHVLTRAGLSEVLGVIRIDLLPHNEAAFRWIAINPAYVGQGLGGIMIKLAEEFVQSHKKAVIRIPATHQSLGFAKHLGYVQEPWDLMPKEDCMVAVSKRF